MWDFSNFKILNQSLTIAMNSLQNTKEVFIIGKDKDSCSESSYKDTLD